MNIGFFAGEVVEIGKFKFNCGKNLNHKSMIEIWVDISKNNIVRFRGYDEIADKILRNKFKDVCITGKIRTDGYVEINEIEKFYTLKNKSKK